jgi:hypothetical protein
MNQALASGAVDIVGLARPLVLEPDLPTRILSGKADRAMAVDLHIGSARLDAALEGMWYARQLRRMASGKEPLPTMSRTFSLLVGVPSYLYNPLRFLGRSRDVPLSPREPDRTHGGAPANG